MIIITIYNRINGCNRINSNDNSGIVAPLTVPIITIILIITITKMVATIF